MRREFLKNLGIEDKDTIDAILNENSADIGRAKTEVDELNSQVTQLKTQLSDKTTEFNNLKDSTKDYETLQNTITTLRTEKTNLENQLNTEVSKLQKAHAIEGSIRDAKAKNVKAVMALLDLDKITYENNELSGISEQLETLKSGEDTSFLFAESQPLPSGTHLNNPPSGNGGTPATSKTLAEAVAKAISK